MPPAGSTPLGGALRGLLCAALAGAALLSVDVVRTALLEPRAAAYSGGDLAWAFASWARWTLPAPAAAGAALGALLGVTRGRLRRRWRACAIGALAVPFLTHSIVEGTRGAWISTLPGLTLIRLAVVAGGGVAVGLAVRAALRHEARGGAWRGGLLASAAFAGSVAAVAVNLRVEVGRYPTLHRLVTAAALAGLAYLAHRAAGCGRRARRLAAAALVLLAPAAGAALLTGLVEAPARDPLARGTFTRLARVAVHLGRPLLRLGTYDSPLDGVTVDPELAARLARSRRPTSPPPTPSSRPDVVLVTLCTARADHMGFLGYERDTTPNLDRLAAEATVFERAYTPASGTVLSLFPALAGRTTPEFYMPLFAGEDEPPNIRRLLEDSGYRVFRGDRVEAARAARAGTRPVLFHLHLSWAHQPYTPKELRFGTTPVDRYDAELRDVDAAVGRLVEDFPGTVFVVFSDHGEEFLDRGSWFHGVSFYDELVRAVLVVRVPDAPPRRVVEAVSTADVAPTLLDLAGVAPPPGLSAWSLASAIRSGAPVERPAVVAITPTSLSPGAWTPPAEVLAMVSDGSWKLIYDARIQAAELYHVARDPGEVRDLAAREPARVAAMLQPFEAHRAEIAERVDAPERWFR